MPDILIAILKISIPFAVFMQIAPVLVWLERKGAAYIQDRRGPNRANIFGFRLGGLLHSMTDVIKIFTKEDVVPPYVRKFFFTIAPMITMAVGVLSFAVIPFADPLDLGAGKKFTFQAADLDVGLLYIFAINSLGVYGVMLAGWASNSKYPLLGGLRASAQMVSFEIAMGLSVISVLLFAGTIELTGIVNDQGVTPYTWNVVRMPIAALIFITAIFAETGRTPFDVAEGEAEIVAGFHTEYSSIKFMLFPMSEYLHMIIGSTIIIALFFGGWHIPFVTTEVLRTHSSSIVWYLLAGLGVGLVFFGVHLFLRKRKFKWGDFRDKEIPILATLFLLLGLAAVTSLFVFFPERSFAFNGMQSQIAAAVMQIFNFLAKILAFCWVFVWVRWTVPRFRYDQIMDLGWKVMLPLALVNIFIYALLKVFL